ncbi:TM2 domain-containing protein CG10795-like [Gigantopelta aegis]|uniref:TM2 domain-containing protein CG10795-like n=1 Tax=Gigantopelta aegis TaxID=1735272 RepID=UPI001B88CD8D|nr:TM2 domain-containing protein CG10795-like [Gigantopelta aegis]
MEYFQFTQIMNVFVLLYAMLSLISAEPSNEESRQGDQMTCAQLLMGQYLCDAPEIDPETQQAKGCNPKTRKVPVPCRPAVNITCDGVTYNGSSVGFYKTTACKWTNGHSFEVSLLLSIFLGMFGIDRFYLGYPAIGLVKFATMGFMFLGQLVDILLIATQVVKPSDGSDYVIDYYGAIMSSVVMDNETYLKPQDYT